MVGNGFVEWVSLKLLRVTYVATDIWFPFLAYQGKARALLALHRNAKAEEVLNEVLAPAREDHNYMALSQLLIVAGTAAASSDPHRAIQNLRGQ